MSSPWNARHMLSSRFLFHRLRAPSAELGAADQAGAQHAACVSERLAQPSSGRQTRQGRSMRRVLVSVLQFVWW